ncbi:hypothetical protein LTR02_008571 [Friedmanniomyces endolithicus]|nr:hypothetical protein LTR94_011360 [Friedmanniomyces endolithicus]KAK0771012.1 hypothetical protein LTR38_017373 [Friedmanniomyces endolithicus]KAK0785854.1 hypothetical protein LTR59_010927 [Friedmanniomyces endolithicus]KAK0799138.1 hypothetical protein LTR75_009337 [Friedmanniomyces endolithicus]KAK0839753.1 hypothetical protein LTR03_011031 [Friedmanniomyces endolithicus]
MAGPSSPSFSSSTSGIDQTNAPSPFDFNYLMSEDFTDIVAGNDGDFNAETTFAPIVNLDQDGNSIDDMSTFVPDELIPYYGNYNAVTTVSPAELSLNGNDIYAPQPQYYAPQEDDRASWYSEPSRPQSVMPIQPMPLPPAGFPGAHYGWYLPVQMPMPTELGSISNPYAAPVANMSSLDRDLTDNPQQKQKRKQHHDSQTLSDNEDKQRPTKRQSNGKTAVRNTTTRSKNLRIAQDCVCPDTEEHIPRPRNAFILYRSAMTKQLSKSNKSTKKRSGGKPRAVKHQIYVSREAGTRWHNETDDVRAHYQDLAEKERIDHAKKYPGYKYRPVRKGVAAKSSRFGTPECTCGAYRANMLLLKEAERKLKEDVLDDDVLDDDEADAPGDEVDGTAYAYPPPAKTRAKSISSELYSVSTVSEDEEVDYEKLFNEAQDPSYDGGEFFE